MEKRQKENNERFYRESNPDLRKYSLSESLSIDLVVDSVSQATSSTYDVLNHYTIEPELDAQIFLFKLIPMFYTEMDESTRCANQNL